MNGDWIIIPDIHGRTFWKEAVKGHEDWNIVFLGDYLDPYSFEGISPAEGTRALEDVIEFKKAHMDNVVLLLGNHDLGYLNTDFCYCRHDPDRADRNRDLILYNLDLFELVHEITLDGGLKVLFSHAGIRNRWVTINDWLLGKVGFSPALINGMFHTPEVREDLLSALSQVSFYRGGTDYVGSPVWADANEFIDTGDFLPGYLHVFGHTLHEGGPILIKAEQGCGWCMDCGEGFRMDASGRMHYIDEGKTENS